MRVLALDIGERRVGVAISDASALIASPLEVLDATVRLPEQVSRLVAEHEVGLVVVGLPLTLSGEEGPQAQRVRAEGDRIGDAIDVPLLYHDERLSSAQAHRAMSAQMSSRKRRGSVDKVAAAIFLQSFLDVEQPGTHVSDSEDSHGR
ncbi:MAG: Holliday junction resolvase RuvX [Coriobacteriia bacterium]|jgi:putative Holliday junction resolvase|nr:Holliday junction resolvase RuvX [Coriobacteriia bacterium]